MCPCAVNLIALPTRLATIWPIRPGSPLIPAGTSAATSRDQLEPFLVGQHSERLERVLDEIEQ